MKKKPTTPLSREAEAFIEMLSAERGASKNTEAAYSADLKNLEAFLARRKQKPVTANADALRAYLKSLDYLGAPAVGDPAVLPLSARRAPAR